MSEERPGPTISLRERSLHAVGSEERLPKWFVVSLFLHLILIAAMFLSPMLPSRTRPMPTVTVVDLVGGERIGGANFGTELTAPPKQPAKNREAPPAPEIKKEVKKEEPPPKEEKVKAKTAEKKPPEEKPVIEAKSKLEPTKTKPEPAKSEPTKEIRREAVKDDSKTETASADSVRERLIQGAVERAKTRSEAAQSSAKGETLSAGSGEGEGAAGLGVGGRGGPGVVRGIDFVIYQNRMLATIKENWSWVGQRSNLRVVVQFGIKENGEIVGLKIVQPSGDPSYDESVLRALKKSNPLPAPPENYRKDFADVEISFRPRDLGA